ncbi:ankyrin repeat domain-containing protein [Endozoicomonas sp. ALB115]|uniref:ankyrin repeat domain-containing protein n=1 Tax=Endozoicomonas sp. ALB115 TaxID=3403074 RepID=UPI003BB59005
MLEIDPSLAKEKDKRGWTALHWAASKGHTEIVREPVSVPGINVNEKNNVGSTALDFAAEGGHTDCEKLLEPYTA